MDYWDMFAGYAWCFVLYELKVTKGLPEHLTTDLLQQILEVR